MTNSAVAIIKDIIATSIIVMAAKKHYYSFDFNLI